MKFLNRILITYLLVVNLISCTANKNDVKEFNDQTEKSIYVNDIQEYGNLVLSIKGTEFLNSGYEFGDIITVSIKGINYDMPVCPNFTDVSQGDLICRVSIDKDLNEDDVIIAINTGDFATQMYIATKEIIDEAPGFKWLYLDEVPCYVNISMKEKGGYKEEYLINAIMNTRTNNREDYKNLSDAEFANFRMVKTSNVKEGILYRSSSPVNPKFKRNKYADEAAKEAKVNTFINLADNELSMKGYEGFNESYYHTKNIIPLNLSITINGDEYRQGIVKAIRFINENDGPYLIHCDEGKDRAGFMTAIIECMMGASAEEVVDDYMITYYNYYHVDKNNPSYDNIKKMNIEKSLQIAFNIEDIYNADLKKECEEFLILIGLNKDEIELARNKLS